MRCIIDRRCRNPRHLAMLDKGYEASLALRKIIESSVASVFAIPLADLKNSSRGIASIALARQVAMYLARVVGGLQLTEVGRVFGRDRTTVAHACSVVERRRDDPTFDLTIDLLEGIVERIRRLSTGGHDWIY